MRTFFFLFVLLFPLVNYASFPVSEIIQKETINSEITYKAESLNEKKNGYLAGIISVLLALIGGFMLVMTIGSAFAGGSVTYLYFILSLASLIGSASLGLNNIIKNKKGVLISIFGLLLGLIGILIIILTL